MKYFKLWKKDDGVEGIRGGAPRPTTAVDPPLGVLRSGTRVRDRAPPRDGDLCLSFAEAYEDNWRYIWDKIQRPGLGNAAKDIFQVVSERLYLRIRDRKMVHPLRPALRGMIDDALLNHYRTLRRQHIDGVPDQEGTPVSQRDPLQEYLAAVDTDDEKKIMEAVFSELEPHEQQILNLLDFEELPVEEAAAKVGITENAAYVRAHRAREKFAKVGRRLRDLLHGKGRKV